MVAMPLAATVPQADVGSKWSVKSEKETFRGLGVPPRPRDHGESGHEGTAEAREEEGAGVGDGVGGGGEV